MGKFNLECSRNLTATVLLLAWFGTASALQAPLTKCYALDQNDKLNDFSGLADISLSGLLPGYKKEQFTLRLCQDAFVNSSENGQVSYGRFAPGNIFRSRPNSTFDFEQYYLYGDLAGCPNVGFGDDGGRVAKVSVSCGECPESQKCQDPQDYGCLCSVDYSFGQNECIIEAVVALRCPIPGRSTFRGFSVGLNPRSSELVNDGVTAWGYDTAQHPDFSYEMEQGQVSLYLSALSSLAARVQPPTFSVVPAVGLAVALSGSATEGAAPTTESPAVLKIDWRCDVASERPFLVNITIPVQGFTPVSFLLGKICRQRQKPPTKASPGWATFGAISCSFLVLSSALCCIGFVYKTHVEDKRGLEALPGLPIISGCLDLASGVIREHFPSNRQGGPKDQYPDSSERLAASSSYGSVE